MQTNENFTASAKTSLDYDYYGDVPTFDLTSNKATVSGDKATSPNTSTAMAKFGLLNGVLDHEDAAPTSTSTPSADNSKTNQTGTSSSSNTSNSDYGEIPTFL